MAKINIPFRPEWELLMRKGLKTATTRTKPYGNVGDIFEAFGYTFQVTAVVKVLLRLMAEQCYKEEGCLSTEEFIKVWESLHPRQGFQPDQWVYLHRFKRVVKVI